MRWNVIAHTAERRSDLARMGPRRGDLGNVVLIFSVEQPRPASCRAGHRCEVRHV